jgi:hypothetical protein
MHLRSQSVYTPSSRKSLPGEAIGEAVLLQTFPHFTDKDNEDRQRENNLQGYTVEKRGLDPSRLGCGSSSRVLA